MRKVHLAAQEAAGPRASMRALTSPVLALVVWTLVVILGYDWQAAVGEPRTTPSALAPTVAGPRRAEGAQPSSAPLPANAREASSVGTRPPSMCVVDDSKDMVDLVDGKPVDLKKREDLNKLTQRPRKRQVLLDGFGNHGGTWPILHYLLPALGCEQCCFWSAFKDAGPRCTTTGACTPMDVRIPMPLSLTSPLVDTISQALRSNLDRDIFFITNGIDWRTEGHNRNYSVELDIGGPLYQWLTADQKRNLVLGLVQDNEPVPRRPNMVIGLVQDFAAPQQSERSCNVPRPHAPPRANIHLSVYDNPKSVLTEGALVFVGSVTLQLSIGGSSPPYAIAPDGRVEIPKATFQQSEKASITFYPPARARKRFCWGMQVRVSDTKPVDADCQPSDDGRFLTCKFPLPQPLDPQQQTWDVAFLLVPSKPAWLEQLPPNSEHALRRTLKSLQQQAQDAPQVQLRALPKEVQPITRLTITLK